MTPVTDSFHEYDPMENKYQCQYALYVQREVTLLNNC